MAAMIAVKRSAAGLLPKLRPLAAARFFGATAEDRVVDVARRPDDSPAPRRHRAGADLFPTFFTDALDPFSRRSISDVFNLMDQMMDFPFAPTRNTAGFRRGWDVKEDEKALHLKIDMPGLGKEDVKVAVDKGTLVIQGEAAADDEGDAGGEGADEGVVEKAQRRYSTRIDLPLERYDVQGIRAEMKNGVLKVVVPKVVRGEGKDVHHVQIE